MIFKLWDTFVDYFKEKEYWEKVQPIFALVSLYLISVVLAYQSIQWRHRFSPSLELFLSSYIFKQITLAIFATGIIAFLLQRRDKRAAQREPSKVGAFIREHGRSWLKKLILVGALLAVVIPVFLVLTPQEVSHIRIKFLQEPEFDKYAFVYLVYELNKRQEDWYFEIDFDTFNEEQLSSEERRRCAGEESNLCYAELLADDRPFIGISTESLGESTFWHNSGRVSVISTDRWRGPPSIYEYLTFAIVVQSILIHLDSSCQGLPERAFEESRVAYGGLLQFSPRRKALKPKILAAHLSPAEEEMIFNCFGVEYLSICSRLLAMEWLHSEKVAANLKKSFDVEL
ncbi:MAG: hypothetical protein GY856_49200 [bacterium]|nr:hypothetical protein [bacterium]